MQISSGSTDCNPNSPLSESPKETKSNLKSHVKNSSLSVDSHFLDGKANRSLSSSSSNDPIGTKKEPQELLDKSNEEAEIKPSKNKTRRSNSLSSSSEIDDYISVSSEIKHEPKSDINCLNTEHSISHVSSLSQNTLLSIKKELLEFESGVVPVETLNLEIKPSSPFVNKIEPLCIDIPASKDSDDNLANSPIDCVVYKPSDCEINKELFLEFRSSKLNQTQVTPPILLTQSPFHSHSIQQMILNQEINESNDHSLQMDQDDKCVADPLSPVEVESCFLLKNIQETNKIEEETLDRPIQQDDEQEEENAKEIKDKEDLANLIEPISPPDLLIEVEEEENKQIAQDDCVQDDRIQNDCIQDDRTKDDSVQDVCEQEEIKPETDTHHQLDKSQNPEVHLEPPNSPKIEIIEPIENPIIENQAEQKICRFGKLISSFSNLKHFFLATFLRKFYNFLVTFFCLPSQNKIIKKKKIEKKNV